MLGLIAGSDQLPLIFARAARKKGERVLAIGVEGYTSPALAGLVEKMLWINSGELGRMINLLKEEGIKNVVMEGKIPQSVVFSEALFDKRTINLLSDLPSKQTETLLGAAAAELAREGIALLDARTYLDELIPPPGILTVKKPTEREEKDIRFGYHIAKEIGRLDIGQTVVVKEQVILAVESIEGTDAAIRRGAALGKEGVVVVKASKPNQDMRFDIPVVGEGTMRLLVEVKASILAIEAEKTAILDREEAIGIANEAGICLVAVEDNVERTEDK